MTEEDKTYNVASCDSRGDTVTGRPSIYLTKGMCRKHYNKYQSYRIPEHKTRNEPRPAIIEGSIAKIPLGLEVYHLKNSMVNLRAI